MRQTFLYLSLICLAVLFTLQPASILAQQTTEEEKPGPRPVPAYDPDAPMHFFTGWNGGAFLRSAFFWIAAEGRITKDTPAAFLTFLEKDESFRVNNEDIKQVGRRIEDIYLHSCGGDEEAAMELGRLFQKMKFQVQIGQTYRDPEYADSSAVSTGNGECRGACILAALGGYPFNAEDIDHLRLRDNGDGTTSSGHTYIPPVLEYFKPPQREIIQYAKRMKVDIAKLLPLLPRNPSSQRKLNLVEAAEIGISLDYVDALEVPEIYRKPCPP